MLNQRNLKRIIILILIISLIYATVYPTIFGLISYAQESEDTPQEEETKALKIEVSDFTKNNMGEEATEYQEKLTLIPSKDKSFEKITISDVQTFVGQENENEENNISEIETYYKTTKIDKLQILDMMGTDGKLVINYETIENENINEEKTSENKETMENAEITSGTLIAQEGIITIDRETETDENGYITIVYPENTVSVQVELEGKIEKIEKFEIINNKVIEKVEKPELIQLIKITKQLGCENNNELVSTTETINKNIYYSKTFAELGIDKDQISTSAENKLNFTISLHTEKAYYDLYKNPYFAIELPANIENVNIDEAVVLNNNFFEGASIDVINNENGNKTIIMKLEGEQTEYTNSEQENMQIVVNTRVKTDKFIPTMLEQIQLHYQNENATTYNGVEKEEEGIQIVPIELVSNKEVMVETEAIFEDKTINSRENKETIVIEPNRYQKYTVKSSAINNAGTDMQNASILCTAKNISEVSSQYKVLYSENPNATTDINEPENNWSETYTPNVQKFLIIIDEFKQSQKISFEYEVELQQNIEEDIMHESKFEVYNNENQIVNVSKIEALQEAQKANVYENNKVNVNIISSKTENVEINDYIDCGVTVQNISGEELKNSSIELSIPENFEKAITLLTINDEQIATPRVNEDNKIQIQGINLKDGENLLLGIRLRVMDYNKKVETIKANIVCENQASIEIFDKINMVEKSQIETTITSNRMGEKLEPNDDIEYKATLKNIGSSHAELDITTAISENMNIIKIKTINLTTGEIRSISGNGLENGINKINIDPNETIEVYVKGIIKDVQENDYVEMYLNINGNKIVETTTDEVINKIHRKEQASSNNATLQANTGNTIKGFAWLDENENGIKDENEMILIGAQAILINTKTSEEVARKITNNKGEYSFKNIPEGNYIVEFRYNKSNFTVTDYTKIENSKGINSNVVSTTQNQETVAKTEVMRLQTGETENINAGFVMNKKFDLTIKEELTKVTVNNNQGTVTYELEDLSKSKIEIDEKYAKDAIIVAQYEITVSNIGEVEGTANLILDKLPEGMEFSSELNTEWYEGEDKNIYSVALANKKIKPGEQETIKLVLTKENTRNNVETVILKNSAKIVETTNSYLLQESNLENNESNSLKTIVLNKNKEGRN